MTQILMYDQTCMHVDGYKSMRHFDTKTIELQCGKKKLQISGNSLLITSFHAEEMIIYGNILSVEWKQEEE